MTALSVAVLSVWVGVTLLAWADGLGLLAALTTLQAGAMAAGAWLAFGARRPGRTGPYDAIAAGILLASAALYVVPSAIVGHNASGSVGVGVGLLIGALLHRSAGRRLDQSMLGALCLHAISAGLVLGVVYTGMPSLGLSLGVAIVAHKLPAGYALARALRDHGRSTMSVALPACAVGLTSLPIAMAAGPLLIPHGLLFGLAGGLFVAVGAAFFVHLPWQRRARAATLGRVGVGALVVACLDIALKLHG